jgi:hypothetical protein
MRLGVAKTARESAKSPDEFEAPGIEPVFQAKAIGVLQSFTASQLPPLTAPIRRGSRESQARWQY